MLFVLIASQSLAQTAIFQQGSTAPFGGGTYTGVQDTMLLTNGDTGVGSTGNRNYGGRDTLEIGTFGDSTGADRHILIGFDLTSMAGQYSAINSVTLRLVPYQVNDVALISNFVDAHLLTPADSDWRPGTLNDVTASGTESTWNLQHASGTPWAGSAGASTPVTDYVSATVASTAWNASTAVSTLTPGATFDLVFTDTSMISSWVSGSNSGIFLIDRTEPSTGGDNRLFFYSSDYVADPALRPELIVNYTAVPEPASVAALLGLGALGAGLLLRRKHIA